MNRLKPKKVIQNLMTSCVGCGTQYINRIHHGCPVEIGKSQPEGPPVPMGNEARRVSHWNGGPEGWDFPFSTGHP